MSTGTAQLHAVAVLDDGRSTRPIAASPSITVTSAGCGEASICSARARAAAAWPSPTSAERIRTRRGRAASARWRGARLRLRRRITGISPPTLTGYSAHGRPRTSGRPRRRKLCSTAYLGRWTPRAGSGENGHMQVTRPAAPAPARAARARRARPPRTGRRRLPAGGVDRAARAAGGACSCSCWMPHRRRRATSRRDSGGWPGWLAGPLAGAGSQLGSAGFQALMLIVCGAYLVVLASARALPIRWRGGRDRRRTCDPGARPAADLPGRLRLHRVRPDGSAARARPLHAPPGRDRLATPSSASSAGRSSTPPTGPCSRSRATRRRRSGWPARCGR